MAGGLPQWVVSQVTRHSPELGDAAAEAARLEVPAVVNELAALLARDIDRQASTPLSILRGAAGIPNRVLVDAGVARPVRSEFDRTTFPDDHYGCTPHGWSDLGEEIAAAGLAWGAAKAFVHLRRRRGSPGVDG